jgi:hypothetical protein
MLSPMNTVNLYVNVSHNKFHVIKGKFPISFMRNDILDLYIKYFQTDNYRFNTDIQL